MFDLGIERECGVIHRRVRVEVTENMNNSGGGTLMGLSNGYYGRSPFTMSQWEELEHQALIFKYMLAGVPVPHNLVLPIQRSFDSVPHAFFHHPTCQFSNPVSFLYDELVLTVRTLFHVLIKELNFSVPNDKN